MTLTMSATERQEFLAGAHVAILAVERPGRAPLAIPVWYAYEPGGEILVWSYPGVKERLVKAARRFTLTVSVGEWPYRYVSVEGPVVGIEEPAPRDVAVAISVRYMGPEEGPGFVDAEYAEDQALFRMRPERWLSADYTNYGSVLA